MTQSLGLVKDVISAVDSKVASYEKKVRLNEIYTKTDSKSIMRMKSGQMFAKEDLKRKKLVRDGSVFLKSATGRLKGEARSRLRLRALQGRAGRMQVSPDRFQAPSSRRSPGSSRYSVLSLVSERPGQSWLTNHADTVRQQGSGAVRGTRRFLKSKESASYSDASS